MEEKQKIVDYVVAREFESWSIGPRVRELMKQGYVPFGPCSVSSVLRGSGSVVENYSQTMVKYAKDWEEETHIDTRNMNEEMKCGCGMTIRDTMWQYCPWCGNILQFIVA